MTRWSEKEYQDFLKGHLQVPAPFAVPDRPTVPRHARTQPIKGRMNKTEAAYAQNLELQRHAGKIHWYEFEPLKLRLAENTFYTPDFGIVAEDGVFEMHEVKGHWEEDARVKIKVAASKFPFRFKALKKTKTGWTEEIF